MSKLELSTNELCGLDITCRESDSYTEMVYLSIDRRYYKTDSTDGCDEMFLTPAQLEQLGRFLISRAEEITTAQKVRQEDK